MTTYDKVRRFATENTLLFSGVVGGSLSIALLSGMYGFPLNIMMAHQSVPISTNVAYIKTTTDDNHKIEISASCTTHLKRFQDVAYSTVEVTAPDGSHHGGIYLGGTLVKSASYYNDELQSEMRPRLEKAIEFIGRHRSLGSKTFTNVEGIASTELNTDISKSFEINMFPFAVSGTECHTTSVRMDPIEIELEAANRNVSLKAARDEIVTAPHALGNETNTVDVVASSAKLLPTFTKNN
jgi:hypothetical protein